MVTAKKVAENVSQDLYELYIQETVKDINDKEVIIPKLIGKVSKSQLEKQIKDLQDKLEAINKIEE